MATVADLINGALRLLGTLAADETCTAAEQTDAFNALNDLVDSWANERLTLYATSRDSYTLTPGLNPHTIGNEGSPTFTAVRPIRIEKASLMLPGNNNELPLHILSDDEWQNTQGKVTQGAPVFLWPETKYPLINLWLNPVPDQAYPLILYTWLQLGRFATPTTVVDIPPGYLKALRSNLAMDLAPEYGVEPSATLQKMAVDSLAAVKRGNFKPSYLVTDPAIARRRPFNVISGDRG